MWRLHARVCVCVWAVRSKSLLTRQAVHSGHDGWMSVKVILHTVRLARVGGYAAGIGPLPVRQNDTVAARQESRLVRRLRYLHKSRVREKISNIICIHTRF